MTLNEWLNSPLYRDRDTKVVERLAELIAVNGGSMHVTGWGIQQFGGGPYGRSGLEMEEALELIRLGGIVDGFCLAGADFDVFKRAVDEEFQRVERAIEEAICGEAAGGSE